MEIRVRFVSLQAQLATDYHAARHVDRAQLALYWPNAEDGPLIAVFDSRNEAACVEHAVLLLPHALRGDRSFAGIAELHRGEIMDWTTHRRGFTTPPELQALMRDALR